MPPLLQHKTLAKGEGMTKRRPIATKISALNSQQLVIWSAVSRRQVLGCTQGKIEEGGAIFYSLGL